MINKNDWTSEELKIFSLYNYKCLHCRINDAVTLHELKPKSLAPKTWNRPENRVPLCNSCHNWCHRISTKQSSPILEVQRKEFLNG